MLRQRRTIRESEEYREMNRLKEIARQDDTNRALLDEYKRLQFRVQAKAAAGETMPEADFQRLQQIGTLLQFNSDACSRKYSKYSRTRRAWIWTC